MQPAVVGPVTPAMRLWHEEQFGPVIPIGVYSNQTELIDLIAAMPYGQQAAIFTSDAEESAPLVDALSTIVGRININTQCGRSPDVIPFSARRSSAMGTMSINDALTTFSVQTVVAGKASAANNAVMTGFEQHSNFLAPL